MATNIKEPTYNLKAVVQQTGLKPDTLRVWERRYGMPQPERTPGGHRLYSQQDINTLRWLVARQNGGLSISRAVELWRQIEAEGRQPLEQTPSVTRPAVVPTGKTMEDLRTGWIDACMNFDERTAESILSQAFALYPPETTCTELLLPALAKIGEGWYQGNTTVQQEHFASALAIRRLEALLVATPAPTRPGRLLVGCPPQEEHTIGALLLSLFLRRQGWDVVYLGANVPMTQLEVTITATQPQLVIFAAHRLPTAATLQEIAELLRDKQIPMAYGGNIFSYMPDLQKRIPGHFLGTDLNEAPRLVEHLITVNPPVPHVEPVSEEYRQAFAVYSHHQPKIESAVWETLNDTEISEHHLSVAGYNLSRNILAALTLGNIDFLKSEIVWVANLLVNYQLPTALLCVYIEAYYKAVDTLLDERADPIKTWLAHVIDSCQHVEKGELP